MDIGIVCSSGSPIGLIPEHVEGKGVGGAELALVTLAEVLAQRGHEVSVYNNPEVHGKHGSVVYRNVGEWSAHKHDTVIVFRTPFPQVRWSRAKKIFWSCDQYTEGNFSTDVFPYVDEVVTISPFHSKYFESAYGYRGAHVIDLGVRTWEYNEHVPKVKNRFVFCSVPGRGLQYLRKAWDRIVKEYPDASLAITSDYRLWGSLDPLNQQHRAQWRDATGVNFHGRVLRSVMVKLQLEAELFAYPCTYDELFCISVAECQVAGAIPITSNAGALPTTNRFGIVLSGDPRTVEWQEAFLETILAHLRRRDILEEASREARKSAPKVFNWDTVALAWEGIL